MPGRKEGRARPSSGWACYHTVLHEFELDGQTLGIIGCAVGSSFAVLFTDQLFASGCRLLISITSAGQITALGPPPYFVLIDRALRDEGTSHHYVPHAEFSEADPELIAQVLMSQHRGLAKAAFCGQPRRMMARLSPKHLLVMLIAVFLTAGFSLSAAQASVMSAKMANAMAMPTGASTGTLAGASMNGDCKACLKDIGDSGNPMHCPPTCIAPVLAVLPQDLAVTAVLHVQQPSTQAAPFLQGRSSLPDPYPPRLSA